MVGGLYGTESAGQQIDSKELAARQMQERLFVPAVRRDIYAILLNPAAPGAPVATPSAEAAAAAASGAIPFEAVCLGKCSGGSPEGSVDVFAFVDRPTAQAPPEGFKYDAELTMHAIQHIGEASPSAMAVTRAFENFLKVKAASWGAAESGRLSVEFLIAFGMEMTVRLDVNHRIRSTKLSADELRTLSTEPFGNFVDQNTLRAFQSMP